MAQVPVKLNANQVVKDIRDGCDDESLMARYGLSAAQLEKLFQKLLERGLVEQRELAARVKGPSEEDYIRLEADDPVEPSDTQVSKDTPRQANVGKEKDARTHLLFAIFCLLWCLPFGIVATVYASRTRHRLQTDDYEGARSSSKAAKKWCWVSVFVGLAFIVSLPVLFILLAAWSPVAAPFIYTLF
jgi:hypothetical protein